MPCPLCPHLSSTQAQFYTLTVILVQLFIKHGHNACIYITHYCLDDKNDKNSYFIRWGCIQLIKSHREDISNVTKIYISNKLCSLKILFIEESWKVKYITKPEAIRVLITLVIIRNVCWAANQRMIMISEGSCDTDWRLKIQLCITEHFKLKHLIKKIQLILYCAVYSYF